MYALILLLVFIENLPHYNRLFFFFLSLFFILYYIILIVFPSFIQSMCLTALQLHSSKPNMDDSIPEDELPQVGFHIMFIIIAVMHPFFFK